jgi:pyruvate dehydrogenase E1 component beta subunit
MHSDAHESKYANSPGIKVVMPATAADAKGLLTQAIRDPDPVLYCEPLRGYRRVKDEVPDGEHVVPFGRARVAREGDDVTVVAWSAAVQLAEEAAELAAAEGIGCTVLDLRTLVPLDTDGLREAVARTGRAVVVQEAPYTAGFGAEVVATVQEEAFWSLEAPVARVAAQDTPYPIASVEQLYLPSSERVLAAIRQVAEA